VEISHDIDTICICRFKKINRKGTAMKKFLNSLQTKLTLSFIALILVVSSLAFFYTFGETKKAIKEIVRTELTALACLVGSDLNGKDGDILGTLKSGEEGTEQFLYIRNKLKQFKESHPDIKYIYTMRTSGSEIRFIVDADYGNETDPGAGIDEVYEAKSLDIFQGFKKPFADKDYYVDKWGALLSGYCPVKNTKGDIIGLVGVDMSNALVLKKQKFLGNTIFIIMGIGILIAALLILIFSKTIIKDIKKLNTIANAISMGDMSSTLDVKRSDEIGDLADSFGRMAASLKIMMMKEEGGTKDKTPGASR
jgi:methyl-accepting chemotaxis protein